MISDLPNVPSGWEKVKFGQIAKIVTDRVDNPQESGLDNYIGLEHLDTDEIRIKRYGSPTEVEATKFLCKKGDIIFGKRRAYLRKLAVTSRDAVVSAHSMVLRAKEDKIDPDFLPWFMQSSQFWKTAFAISEGSLSPTIKWKTLSAQEFWLPSKLEQKKIAKILWTIEDNVEKTENLIQVAEKLKKELLEELLTKGIGHKKFKKTELGEIPQEWQLRRFSDIIAINPESLSSRTEIEYELEYIDISSIEGPNNITRTEKYKFANAPSRARRIVRKRDVIISTVRPYLKGFALICEDKRNLICSTGFSVLRETDLIVAEYIFQYCLSELFEYQSNMAMVGSNYPSLNNDAVEKLLIPLPPVEEQTRIVSILTHVDVFLTNLKSNSLSSANLKKKLTNSLLSGELIISMEDRN